MARPLDSRSLTALLILACMACTPANPGNLSSQAQSGQTSTSSGPRRVVASMMGEPVGFIARMNTTQISIPGVSVLEQLVNACLAELTGSQRLQPLLAEAVPSVENGLWR